MSSKLLKLMINFWKVIGVKVKLNWIFPGTGLPFLGDLRILDLKGSSWQRQSTELSTQKFLFYSQFTHWYVFQRLSPTYFQHWNRNEILTSSRGRFCSGDSSFLKTTTRSTFSTPRMSFLSGAMLGTTDPFGLRTMCFGFAEFIFIFILDTVLGGFAQSTRKARCFSAMIR